MALIFLPPLLNPSSPPPPLPPPTFPVQMEINFLDYVVRPLWEQLVEVVPELRPQLETIAANREQYARLAAAAVVTAVTAEAELDPDVMQRPLTI